MPGPESSSLLVRASATVATAPLPDDLSGIAIESFDVPATTVDAVSPVFEVSVRREGEDVPPYVENREHEGKEGVLLSGENRHLVEREDVTPPRKTEGKPNKKMFPALQKTTEVRLE